MAGFIRPRSKGPEFSEEDVMQLWPELTGGRPYLGAATIAELWSSQKCGDLSWERLQNMAEVARELRRASVQADSGAREEAKARQEEDSASSALFLTGEVTPPATDLDLRALLAVAQATKLIPSKKAREKAKRQKRAPASIPSKGGKRKPSAESGGEDMEDDEFSEGEDVDSEETLSDEEEEEEEKKSAPRQAPRKAAPKRKASGQSSPRSEEKSGVDGTEDINMQDEDEDSGDMKPLVRRPSARSSQKKPVRRRAPAKAAPPPTPPNDSSEEEEDSEATE